MAGRTAKSGAGAAGASIEGKKAPAFKLSDGAGAQVALKDLLGKKALVLYFYPKDMTPGCTKEACDFRDGRRALTAAGAEVVGVSPDSPQSHQKFTATHGLNFRLLSDPDHKVASLYGVWKKKSLFGREFMGIERTTFVIDSGGIVRKVFPRVRVDGHADRVLETLKAL